MGSPASDIFGSNLSLFISVISVIISAVILLVYLYQSWQRARELKEQRRQIDNQEKQLETQQAQLGNQERQLEAQERQLEQYQKELEELERQTELAEIEHKAYLEIEDYKFEGDRIIVLISNFGNGVAKNLRLKTKLETDGPDHLKLQPGTSRLRRRNGSDQPYEGQALRSGEQRISFEGEAIVGIKGLAGNSHQQSLRGVLMDLREAEAGERPKVTFSVVAETLTEETHCVQITDRPLVLSIPDDGEVVSIASTVSHQVGF